MDGDEIFTYYEYDEEYEDTKRMILLVLDQIKKAHDKQAQPWIEKLAHLESFRRPHYIYMGKLREDEPR